MKKQGETAIRVEYLDAGKKRTPDQQMQAIRGVSIDEFVRILQRNEGGRFDKIFLPQ